MNKSLLSVLLFLPTLLAYRGLWADGNEAGSLYRQYCSVCHGDRGDGKSRAQGSMIPPPRDFTSAQSSFELTRERMIRSVTEGRPGTAMAGWKDQLDEEQISAVVEFIRITMMRPSTREDGEQGRRLYAENCSVCHGDDGRGARWTLTNLKPPPRNFTLPGSAELLPRHYMRKVVRFGKADTAMPGFSAQLNDDEIASVVDYVRRAFMSTIENEKYANSLDVAKLPVDDMDAPLHQGVVGDITRGQRYYALNCVACHGVKGDGKGPRSYFILPKPRNFQHAASRHMLNRPKLYSAIARGSRGTDMPAWDKVSSVQQIADIVEYVYRVFIRPEQPASHSGIPAKG